MIHSPSFPQCMCCLLLGTKNSYALFFLLLFNQWLKKWYSNQDCELSFTLCFYLNMPKHCIFFINVSQIAQASKRPEKVSHQCNIESLFLFESEGCHLPDKQCKMLHILLLTLHQYMSLGAGVLRIGGAGQSCGKKRRYPWQPCKRPPLGTVTLNHSLEYLPPMLTCR